MNFFILYIAQKHSSVSITLGSVGLSRRRLGAEWDFTIIESSLPSYSYIGAHDGDYMECKQ